MSATLADEYRLYLELDRNLLAAQLKAKDEQVKTQQTAIDELHREVMRLQSSERAYRERWLSESQERCKAVSDVAAWQAANEKLTLRLRLMKDLCKRANETLLSVDAEGDQVRYEIRRAL